jgi:hypothetical protein
MIRIREGLDEAIDATARAYARAANGEKGWETGKGPDIIQRP